MDEEPKKPDFRVIDYPFHLGDLVGGTTNLDDSQFGAYMRILIANINAQAKHGGLTDNEEILRSYTRLGPAAWKKLWLLIGEKFVRENGKIYHPRVKETVNKIIKNSNTAQANRLKRQDSNPTGVIPGLEDSTANPKTQNPKPITKDKNPDSSEESREGSGSGFSVPENGAGHSARGGKRFDIDAFLDDKDRASAKALVPGDDIYFHIREYNAWIEKTGQHPDKPVAAFLGFLKKKKK